MSWKIKIALLSLFTLAAFGVGIYSPARRQGNSEASPPLLPTNSREPAAAPDPDSLIFSLAYKPQVGLRYTYNFDRQILIQGLSDNPRIVYSGQLFLDIIHVDASGFDALASQRLKGNQSGAALRIHANLAGNQLVINSQKSLNEDEKQQANILKDLLSLWLFPLDQDTCGIYTARLEPWSKQGQFTQRIKSKINYIGGPQLPHISNSSHTLVWDSTLNLPHQIYGREDTELGSGKISLSSQSSYEINFSLQSAMPVSSLASYNSLKDQDSLALTSDRPSLNDNPAYANLRWDRLLEKVDRVDQLNHDQQLELFGDLVKFLKIHPESELEMKALLSAELLQKGNQSEVFKLIVGSLATVASPQALALLISAYQDAATSIGSKGTILAALTTTQAPLDATSINFLQAEMQNQPNGDLASGAAFALGSALQKDGNTEASGNAIAQILQTWENKRIHGSLEEQLSLLDTMGNSGRAEFLPSLEAVIGNADSEGALVARAIYAMRFIQSAEATQRIIGSLLNPQEYVREAALRAIQSAPWQESFRSPLQNCANSETIARIKSDCEATLVRAPQMAGR